MHNCRGLTISVIKEKPLMIEVRINVTERMVMRRSMKNKRLTGIKMKVFLLSAS